MKSVSLSRLIIYFFYGIIITFILIYFRFPTEKFKNFCENQIEKSLVNTTCVIGKIDYGFPLSVIFENVKITKHAGERQSDLMIDAIQIRPRITFWNSFRIQGKLYSGTIRARLDLNNAEKSYKLVDAVVNNLNLTTILKDQGLEERKVTGSMSGSGYWQAEWGAPEKATGKAKIKITKGSINFLQPVLSLSTLRYEQINFDIQYEQQLKILSGKLLGVDLNSDFEGNIQVMNSLFDSRLNITGLLEPSRTFLQKNPIEAKMVKLYAKKYKKAALPFRINGMVSSPTLRLSR